MKKWILKVVFLLVILTNAKGQNTQVVDNQKFIEVTGHAELAFVPDQIMYLITITIEPTEEDLAYMKSALHSGNIFRSKIDAKYFQVWEILKSEGIDENALVKNRSYNFNKHSDTYYEGKEFALKINNFSKFQKVVEKLIAADICNGQVIDVKSNKIQELEDKVKILAIEDAKRKADKMASAANSRVGNAWQIKEAKQPFENALGKGVQGEGNAYTPYSTETYFVMDNIESTKNGEFVVKQSFIVRFLLEN